MRRPQPFSTQEVTPAPGLFLDLRHAIEQTRNEYLRLIGHQPFDRDVAKAHAAETRIQRRQIKLWQAMEAMVSFQTVTDGSHNAKLMTLLIDFLLTFKLTNSRFYNVFSGVYNKYAKDFSHCVAIDQLKEQCVVEYAGVPRLNLVADEAQAYNLFEAAKTLMRYAEGKKGPGFNYRNTAIAKTKVNGASKRSGLRLIDLITEAQLEDNGFLVRSLMALVNSCEAGKRKQAGMSFSALVNLITKKPYEVPKKPIAYDHFKQFLMADGKPSFLAQCLITVMELDSLSERKEGLKITSGKRTSIENYLGVRDQDVAKWQALTRFLALAQHRASDLALLFEAGMVAFHSKAEGILSGNAHAIFSEFFVRSACDAQLFSGAFIKSGASQNLILLNNDYKAADMSSLSQVMRISLLSMFLRYPQHFSLKQKNTFIMGVKDVNRSLCKSVLNVKINQTDKQLRGLMAELFFMVLNGASAIQLQTFITVTLQPEIVRYSKQEEWADLLADFAAISETFTNVIIGNDAMIDQSPVSNTPFKAAIKHVFSSFADEKLAAKLRTKGLSLVLAVMRMRHIAENPNTTGHQLAAAVIDFLTQHASLLVGTLSSTKGLYGGFIAKITEALQTYQETLGIDSANYLGQGGAGFVNSSASPSSPPAEEGPLEADSAASAGGSSNEGSTPTLIAPPSLATPGIGQPSAAHSKVALSPVSFLPPPRVVSGSGVPALKVPVDLPPPVPPADYSVNSDEAESSEEDQGQGLGNGG